MKTSKCSSCLNHKDIKEFCKRPWGYNSWCRDCSREKQRLRQQPKTWWGIRRRDELTDKDYKQRRHRCKLNGLLKIKKMRVCSCCNTLKQLNQFHLNQYTCKECRLL